MPNTLLAIIFATASALTIAWGTVVRHNIAAEAPEGHSIATAMRRPLWWAGSLSALGAYGLQVVALGFGTLLVVQPILVLSLMFTLPLSAYYDKHRLTVGEMFWAGILTVSVSVLVILGRPASGNPDPSLHRWVLAISIGVVALVALDRWAQRQIRREKALLLGIVTGAVFGYVAVLSKAIADIFVHGGGVRGIATSWELYALLACAVIGTLVQQVSFNAGALKNSLPAMKVSEPIVAFILGYAVLGESFQASGWQWAWMAVALLAMIGSTFQLSRLGID
ncbi:hypothetical protein CCICO_00750 [Corynebacterium ciconiae DSM 44920]|uniref:DMT family transporter n=1 Tax=Corynebacterium ciconiae TaxID=227319 RepID=UPI00036B0B24|nr:DMT family transporter [Corynebacterium ciconiae]WKD60208.1 hypothetical protein CCICO_00750 [Corynebacterium ciconiae DSM 44920]